MLLTLTVLGTENKYPTVMIFEDDTALPPSFWRALSEALTYAPDDFELLNLNHNRLLGRLLPGGAWLQPLAMRDPRLSLGFNGLMNACARPPWPSNTLALKHPGPPNTPPRYLQRSARILLPTPGPPRDGSVQTS